MSDWIDAALRRHGILPSEPDLAAWVREKLEAGRSRIPVPPGEDSLCKSFSGEPTDDVDRWLRFCESLLRCDNAPGIPFLEDAAVADPSTALWIIAAGRSVFWRSGANPSRTIRDFLRRCVQRDPNWENRLEEIRRDGADALRPLAAIAQAILESAPGWNSLLSAPPR